MKFIGICICLIISPLFLVAEQKSFEKQCLSRLPLSPSLSLSLPQSLPPSVLHCQWFSDVCKLDTVLVDSELKSHAMYLFSQSYLSFDGTSSTFLPIIASFFYLFWRVLDTIMTEGMFSFKVLEIMLCSQLIKKLDCKFLKTLKM